jgi:hypothetical protein
MNGFRTLVFLCLVFTFSVSGAQIEGPFKYKGDGIDVVDVPYVPTPEDVVFAMLNRAQAGPGDIHYDLGSGDGRIVVSAVRDFNVDRAVGVDLDPVRVKEANENARRAGVTDRTTFYEADIFDFDFHEATVLTLYLLPEINLRLRPRILNELAPGTRVVSHAFNMEDWEADEIDNIGGRHIYYWVVPANAAGEWQWTMRGDQYRAVISQEFQNISGDLIATGARVPLQYGAIKGNLISFETRARDSNGQTQAMLFEGTVTGDAMEAMVYIDGKSTKVTARRSN